MPFSLFFVAKLFIQNFWAVKASAQHVVIFLSYFSFLSLSSLGLNFFLFRCLALLFFTDSSFSSAFLYSFFFSHLLVFFKPALVLYRFSTFSWVCMLHRVQSIIIKDWLDWMLPGLPFILLEMHLFFRSCPSFSFFSSPVISRLLLYPVVVVVKKQLLFHH